MVGRSKILRLTMTPFVFLLFLSSSPFLPVRAASVYEPCGCVETANLPDSRPSAWLEMRPPASRPLADLFQSCANFCTGGRQLTLTAARRDRRQPNDNPTSAPAGPAYNCSCFLPSDAQLHGFDCGEEEGVALTEVFCTRDEVEEEMPERFQRHPRNMLARIRLFPHRQQQPPQPTGSREAATSLRLRQDGEDVGKSQGHSVDFFHEPTDKDQAAEKKQVEPPALLKTKKGSGVLLAMVLAVLCLLVLTALGLKAWCEHRAMQKKEVSMAVAVTVASSAAASASALSSIGSQSKSSTQTSLGDSSPEPQPRQHRLQSLSTVRVYEKH